MKLEIVTPEEYMGDIIGDLNRRRGMCLVWKAKAGAKVISAKVPLAEQFGYVTVLRTYHQAGLLLQWNSAIIRKYLKRWLREST
jgi:translation elongation factor EF-G